MLIPLILLLEICWHGRDLDRLDYLGCSVACLQICCLALSWPKFQDIGEGVVFQVFVASGVSTHWRCKIVSKECPCTTFCQKPFCQRHGVGPLLAAPNKDQTSWKTGAPKWQTFCMLCILGLQEYATMICKYWSVSGVQNVYAQLGLQLPVHLVLPKLQENPKEIKPVEEMGTWNLRCLQSTSAWWLADGSSVQVNIPQARSNYRKCIPGFQVRSAVACKLYCLVFDLSSVWDEEFALHSLIFCWKRVQLMESERYFLFWTVSFCNLAGAIACDRWGTTPPFSAIEFSLLNGNFTFICCFDFTSLWFKGSCMLHVTCLLGTGHPRSSFASSNRNCKKKKNRKQKKDWKEGRNNWLSERQDSSEVSLFLSSRLFRLERNRRTFSPPEEQSSLFVLIRAVCP